MPLTPAGATGIIAAGLVSSGQLGTGVPKLASAIATGVDVWIHALPVLTTDVGAIGVGTGEIPLVVPNPLLLSNLSTSFVGQGILGVMAPNFILGLTNGLVLAFLQALVITAHPGVGDGTAIVRFGSTSAVPPLLAAFAANGMTNTGSIKMATAIGIGLSTTFTALTLVSPIVGAGGPYPSSGVGFGNVV
jgi:hypothetical protein